MSSSFEYLKITFQLRRNYLDSLLPTAAEPLRIQGMVEAYSEVIKELERNLEFTERQAAHASRKINKTEQV